MYLTRQAPGVCSESACRQVQELKESLPQELSEMSFEDYRSLITNRHNWALFEGVLGKNKALVGAKLECVRDIRNDVFHFREGVSVLDYETLATTRQWLFQKMRILGSEQEAEQSNE